MGRINIGECGYRTSRIACKYGHPWIEENIYRNGEGFRECRICKLTRRRNAKRRERGVMVVIEWRDLDGRYHKNEFGSDEVANKFCVELGNSGIVADVIKNSTNIKEVKVNGI